MESNASLKIAIQKSGRLSEGSVTLLRKMGLQFESYESGLFARCRTMPIDILFLRDDDIPEYVQDGVCDLGIVGQNVLREKEVAVEEIQTLNFGFCKLCIAIPEQKSYSKNEDLNDATIATSYPRTLSSYLTEKNIKATIITLKGSTEIAPALGIADAICDLVSTGSTLRTNRLKAVETVATSQATLIGSLNPCDKNRELVKSLLTRARGVQEAERTKYIMFNIKESSLDAVQRLVPGCESPSVIKLMKEGWIAVHAVVEEDRFWDVVEQIQACGGTSILVTPIEKFIQ